MIIVFFNLILICAFEFVSRWTHWSHKIRLVEVIKWKPVGIIPYLIRGYFHSTRPHLIYVVRGSETCDVEGPTSIIQKVMTAKFGGRTLNELDCFET